MVSACIRKPAVLVLSSKIFCKSVRLRAAAGIDAVEPLGVLPWIIVPFELLVGVDFPLMIHRAHLHADLDDL